MTGSRGDDGDRVVLVSPHPPSEVRRRLGGLPSAGGVQRAYLRQVRRLLSGDVDDLLYARSTDEGWRVWFVRTFVGYPNVPVLALAAEDHDAGTRVTGTFTTPLLGKLFVGYLAVFGAVFAWAVVTSGTEQGSDAPLLWPAMPLVVLVLVVGGIWRMTTVLVRADRRTVVERLARLLDAEPG